MIKVASNRVILDKKNDRLVNIKILNLSLHWIKQTKVY